MIRTCQWLPTAPWALWPCQFLEFLTTEIAQPSSHGIAVRGRPNCAWDWLAGGPHCRVSSPSSALYTIHDCSRCGLASGLQIDTPHTQTLVFQVLLIVCQSCRAAAKAGKSVLHLDVNQYYGSGEATLEVPAFLDLVQKSRQKEPSVPTAPSTPGRNVLVSLSDHC